VADYETLRQRQVERMLEMLPEYFARSTWPAERLRAERERALRALVAHAQARSPWHARRLQGIDAERLREADLGTLPVMTKDDLMEHFDEIVTDPVSTATSSRPTSPGSRPTLTCSTSTTCAHRADRAAAAVRSSTTPRAGSSAS
jgi:phenylacetate-coenzyme A ligase PaaK-like adenylate-forming protein